MIYTTEIFKVIVLEFIYVILLIIAELKEQSYLTLVFKTLSSMMFVLLGSSRLILSTGPFNPIFIGLCFGAVGDVLLAISLVSKRFNRGFFASGGAMFFIGHIFYLISSVKMSRHVVAALALCCVITGMFIWQLYKRVNLEKPFKIIGLGYVFMVSFMASNGLVNLMTIPGRKTLLFGIGAIMFLISDILLIIERFIKERSIYTVAVLLFYYVGQTLIALSI